MAKPTKSEPEVVELKNSATPGVLPTPFIKKDEPVKVQTKSEKETDHKAPVISGKELFKSLCDASVNGRMARLIDLGKSNQDIEWLLSELNNLKNKK